MDSENGKLTLLVCGNMVRETRAAIAAEGFEDVLVKAYAPGCGNPRRPDAMRAVMEETLSSKTDAILVAGGCLSAANAAGIPLGPGSRICRVDSCFELVADGWKIEELFMDGTYVLTPGWLGGWKARISEWGFDRDTARSFFSEGISSLVLLDTGVDERSAANLEEFAAYLDKPFSTIPVGLQHFRLFLSSLVQKWRLDTATKDLRTAAGRATRLMSDQAMVFDLIAGMTHMDSEAETTGQILDLFEMLFAPQRLIYATVRSGQVTGCTARPSPAPALAGIQAAFDAGWDREPQQEGKVRHRISFKDELLGLLEVEHIAFAGYREEYQNLMPALVEVCGLGIANARMFQDIRQLAVTDTLTGLMNRRQFLELATAEFARTVRYDRPLSVLLLDIDLFKHVNDTYGHQTGDSVLVEFSRRLRVELRASDLCARYGGEEFIVLMPETVLDMALQVAERIRLSIAGSTMNCGAREVRVTVSLGVAIRDTACQDLDTLIGRSDQAMYDAKQAGRNLVRAWDGLTALSPHIPEDKSP
jgi:diguanylate cyclase (GGDEF)-like protein